MRRKVLAIQSIANKQIDRAFMFDKVFRPKAQQPDLYNQSISPIVNEVLHGFNYTVFAYGQSGTGKTYTMEGGKRPKGPSQRKSPLLQRKVLRKRRSLKKQRNQVGRVQPSSWFNSKAKEEAKADALQNAREAENAWHRSIEAAVPLRQRAQLLMENADLATYKSVMALRIAEAIRSKSADHSSSSSSSLSSSLLDWLPEDLSNCN